MAQRKPKPVIKTTADTMKATWRSLGTDAAFIVLLTVAVYWPTMRAGFVFDDRILITANPMVRASDGLHRFWVTTQAPDYYPLTWSLWWAEWRLWDGKATGYHVVNVLLHAVDAVLVWLVLRRLKIPAAWLAALVFAIHPVNVATVAWVSEQKNTLSMLFFALSILLYLRFDDATDMGPVDTPLRLHSGQAPRVPTNGAAEWMWYGLALATGLLALLAKTAVVMLPVVLLGCVWWRHGQLRWRDIGRILPFFALSLVLAIVTIWFQRHRALEGRTLQTVGFASRLATAGWVPWFYLFKALLPIDLTLVYPKWQVNPGHWISYVPGVIWLGSFVVFWWRRKSWGRPLLFGLGYFVAMLFPVLGFFDQAFYRYSWVADHWQYYSIVGIIAVVVAGGQTIGDQLGEPGRRGATLAGAAVVVVLAAMTWQRGCVYVNDETLWRDNVAKTPTAWVAHNNLGLVLWQKGKPREAIEQYEQALKIKPDYAEAHDNLGAALVRLGKLQEAAEQIEQALRIEPGDAAAENNLGAVLARAGKFEQAITHYTQALKINPRSAEAHCNLGLALEHVGKIHDAIDHYEQALRISPDYADAQGNLAWLLATLAPAEGGDPARALTLAQRACGLTGNRVPSYLDALAAAYAAAGRFTEAVDTAQKAVALARSAGRPQVADEIQRHLELYRNGHAYRR